MLSGFSAIFVMLVMLASPGSMQTSSSATTAPDHETQSVKITHGPVVELITDSTAQIAWSTNVNAGTLVHYGADPNNLDQKASMPWGGITHRVVLKHLNPSTTYYFMAESNQGQDTGTQAQTPQESFKTVGQGEPPVHHMDRR